MTQNDMSRSDGHKMLEPSVTRAEAIDTRLRIRLVGSLDYLASFVDPGAGGLDRIRKCISAGPVSPWVFAAYAQLVQALSRKDMAAARSASDLLGRALAFPAALDPSPIHGSGFPEACWNVAQMLFDTDPARPFAPVCPTDDEVAGCRTDIDAAMALLARGDPDFHAELRNLQRMILLGRAPSDDAQARFNGASTFFLWGGILLNALPRRSPALAVDVLVHEASHMLLFGLVDGGALSENDPAARYSSPLRDDPRPIDGIFHACFVATRVHLAMTRIILARRVPQDVIPALAERADANARAARSALALLRDELRPSSAGKPIFAALTDYWQSAEVTHA
jgi:HEXXH motif-containing protein